MSSSSCSAACVQPPTSPVSPNYPPPSHHFLFTTTPPTTPLPFSFTTTPCPPFLPAFHAPWTAWAETAPIFSANKENVFKLFWLWEPDQKMSFYMFTYNNKFVYRHVIRVQQQHCILIAKILWTQVTQGVTIDTRSYGYKLKQKLI